MSQFSFQKKSSVVGSNGANTARDLSSCNMKHEYKIIHTNNYQVFLIK